MEQLHNVKKVIIIKLLVLLTVFIVLPLNILAAAAGSLDTTFDGDGKLTTVLTAGNIPEEAQDVEIQTDGKILVAGKGGSPTQFMVTRYNANGSLDTTFNGTGSVSTTIGSVATARSIGIQPNGKIIVAGDTLIGGIFNFALVRYNANGSLDTNFGTGGIVTTSFGAGLSTQAVDAETQTDGKIIILGTKGSGSAADFALARYNLDGSLDTTFDTDGLIIKDVSGNLDGAGGLTIRNNGKIIAAGFADGSFAVLRYNDDGSPDTTFDGDGVVTTDITGGSDFATDVISFASGKLFVSGYSNNSDFALVSYNSNGSLDTGFDGDGIVTTDLGSSSDKSNRMVIQTDGKIILAGYTNVNLNLDFALVRYNLNGSLDTSFDGDGKVITPFGTGIDIALGVVLQSDGKIVAAGYSASSIGNGNDIAIARYNSHTTFVQDDFDGDSKTDVSIFRPSLGEWWYLKSSTLGNAALQFGSSTDKLTPGDFTGDGKVDIAFWRPSTGFWFILRSEDNSFFSFPFGTSGDIPAPADYDGDGKTDPAVFRPSVATWFISRSSDGGTTIASFGATADKPVPADYDGDGKADIAIWRPSVGEWWYAKSSNGQTVALQFGASTDKPVQGDYTGDGKADVAFWRPSTGFWFVQRSEDGSFFSFPFGANGDVPVPGDYDGDGKYDSAVFRPSNSTWFLNQTTAGVGIVTFGITGDQPVPNAFVP